MLGIHASSHGSVENGDEGSGILADSAVQGAALTVFNAAYRAATLKAVTGAANHHCPGLRQAPELPVTLDSVADSVFGLSHWCQQENHLGWSVTPFGLGEARILRSGSCLYAGVRCSLIDGGSLQEKLQRVKSSEGLTSLFSHGCWCHFRGGCVS